MLIKEENFRNLYQSHVIIKDEEFSKQIAQSIQIDSVYDSECTDDEFKEKLASIEMDENTNAILALPYIDHQAGMSFLVFTTAHLMGENVTIFKRQDFDVMSVCRKDSVNDFEFEYLKNLKVNDDFDLEDYSDFSKIAAHYYVNPNVEMLRYQEILDGARNEDYPDDLIAVFIKEGLEMEKMWVRCEDLDSEKNIDATLLNTPYQDFGVKAGDQVKVFPHKLENGEWIVICDLNSQSI